jgi:hypothetical protein
MAEERVAKRLNGRDKDAGDEETKRPGEDRTPDLFSDHAGPTAYALIAERLSPEDREWLHKIFRHAKVPENDPLWAIVGAQVALSQSQAKGPLELEALSKRVDALHDAMRQYHEAMDRQVDELRQAAGRNSAAGSKFLQHADALHFFERRLYVVAGGTIFILGLLASNPLSDLIAWLWVGVRRLLHL